MLTLLKQRKISCILKVESLQRGIGKDQEVTEGMTDMADVERELEEVERKMSELEKEREDRSKRIMDRRVLQVTTLQELGLLEAAGKESRWRSETDLKAGDGQLTSESPSPRMGPPQYSPASSSSHTSHKLTPPLRDSRYRGGSDPSITRPDPSSRLHPHHESEPAVVNHGKQGLVAKLSPRLGRRNPLRMLSNAIDFRARRKHRPNSADIENNEDSSEVHSVVETGSMRSSSVTDILECVSHSPQQQHQQQQQQRPQQRVLEGRNSAPDMLGDSVTAARAGRNKSKLSAAAKQKLSTRFQPQPKVQHRVVDNQNQFSSVKRAQTFSLGGPGQGPDQRHYKTLPKKSSSRKSSNSSNISDCSMTSEISPAALEEIAAFEKFITEYFENSDNNNTIIRKPSQHGAKSDTGQNKTKQKL